MSKTKLSPAQYKLLANLDRTAFYGQNIKTFDALCKKGLIRRVSGSELTCNSDTGYRLTDAGRMLLGEPIIQAAIEFRDKERSAGGAIYAKAVIDAVNEAGL